MGQALSLAPPRVARAVRSELVDLTASLFEAIGDDAAFPVEPVFSALCQPLQARGAVLQRIDWWSGASTISLHGYSDAWLPRLLDATRTLRHSHPLLVRLAEGDLAPATAEQAAGGWMAWHSSESRDFLTELMEAPQIVSVGLRGGPVEVVGLAFSRSGPDFGARELALLEEVQPVLLALDRHLARLQRWRSSLGRGGDVATASVVDTGLTGRQVEVLVLLAQGLTAAAIARRLGCSPRTIHHHVANLFGKLGVHDRLRAVLEAQRRGLLPLTQTG